MAAILLAEDSPTHTALIKSLLEDDAHDVQCVVDGRQAVDSLEESLPDLVVTDLRMPEMNGLELLNQCRLLHPETKTVLVSGWIDDPHELKAPHFPHVRLQKPFNMDELLRRLSGD